MAKVRRENITFKMENEILKKQPRTLRMSRYKVLGDEADTASLPRTALEPDSESISQWFICLD